MPDSDANKIAIASPRSRASVTSYRIRSVRIPWRRWLGSTLTSEMPAASAAPPGTVRRNEYAPAVPTIWVPSKAAMVRSNSMTWRSISMASGGHSARNA